MTDCLVFIYFITRILAAGSYWKYWPRQEGRKLECSEENPAVGPRKVRYWGLKIQAPTQALALIVGWGSGHAKSYASCCPSLSALHCCQLCASHTVLDWVTDSGVLMKVDSYSLLLLLCTPARTLGITAFVKFLPLWPFSHHTGSRIPTSGEWYWL